MCALELGVKQEQVELNVLQVVGAREWELSYFDLSTAVN